MKNTLTVWLTSFVRLFFPRHCVVCGRPLLEAEEGICLRCNMDMPRTNYHRRKDNPAECLFLGGMSPERATSLFFYRKGSDFRHVVHLLKYNGRKDLGEIMGRLMAAELSEAGFFRGVDVLIPIPLHPFRQRERGYNQSECIARGISAVTGIPVDASSVRRCKYTESQTRKSVYERWENMKGIFSLSCPERFVGKHILLVDDVLTTGATTTACADAFQGVEDVRFSVLTLAIAD
ncbi:ComF family protein [Bacteroides sp.]|uniref:ComF family protein n=1 Tax=Bacteroides sp. TaxID=29523 RepID=UPI0023BF3559|nr:ComF family protein [Bacteroides sp.]MDE6216429.1 ComF family protein [Bacteroides sp.]